MLSINTNLSSLIAQNSMNTSTNKLNQAIERMTTGYKINHAKDNAANYSISTNMTTKIGAYMVAEDNVLSGLDLVSTATEVISMMEDRASRLSALSIQARNGTNGARSLEALNAEAGAIVSEITRLYNSTQFNNVNLFNRTSFSLDENLPQAGSSGFIEEPIATFAMRSVTPEAPTAKAEYGGFIENPYTYTDAEVVAMTALTDDVTTVTSGQKYSISSVAELENLAELVNSGVDTTGAIFVLGADIDLSSVANWTPIGTSTNSFKGEFDGNGHKISNLTISKNAWGVGFFSCISNISLIKNIKLESINIKDTTGDVGGLVGSGGGGSIINSIVSGEITGGQYTGGITGRNAVIESCIFEGKITTSSRYIGGLVGSNNYSIANSFAVADVKGATEVGGLVGIEYSSINNCYAIGNIVGSDGVGGLCGVTHSNVTDCFSKGSVKGATEVGGLVGSFKMVITNCYSESEVIGSGSRIGGLIGTSFGYSGGTIKDCYATGNITSGETSQYVGGFIGYCHTKTSNCYATGDVNGYKHVGGFAGYFEQAISNSYSTGDVTSSENNAGGFAGTAMTSLTNCYSTGNVKGVNNVGGLVGYTNSTLTTCYSTGAASGEQFVGGLVGQGYKVSGTTTYTECYAYGNANGTDGVGGLIGGSVLTTDGTTFGKINTVDCQAVKQNADSIGGVYQYDSATSTYTLLNSYDSSGMVAGVKEFTVTPTRTSLLLGINGNDSDQITFDTNFVFDFSPMHSSVDSEEFSQSVNLFVKQLQEKTTILGAVQNRLESALDEISIKYENLVSSRSTIRDADIAEVSSQYIQQQILQQAAATLMSTANQSPAIALQLI